MSNYSDNKKAIDEFRKELRAMLGDIGKIDVKVLNQAINEGVAFAKRHTPVGVHPNPVTFTVKRGPDAGRIVSFSVSNPGVGGFLRKSWHKKRTKKVALALNVSWSILLNMLPTGTMDITSRTQRMARRRAFRKEPMFLKKREITLREGLPHCLKKR